MTYYRRYPKSVEGKCDWRRTGDNIRYLRGGRYVDGLMWSCGKCGKHSTGGRRRSPPRDGCRL